MNLLTIATDGFEDVELLATSAILRRSGFQVDLYSLHPQPYITGSYQTKVIPLGHLAEIDVAKYDGIFLPGGSHTAALRNHSGVLDLVAHFVQHQKWTMAICAAPSILGVLGFLDGKHYTCFPGFESYMKQGIHVNQKAVRDGFIITGAGAGASLEFAFTIIETIQGKEQAEQIKQKTRYLIEPSEGSL